jgi:hypothetical protein
MEWIMIYRHTENKVDSPELMEILDMIQVVMTRTEAVEMGIRFMTVSSRALILSR